MNWSFCTTRCDIILSRIRILIIHVSYIKILRIRNEKNANATYIVQTDWLQWYNTSIEGTNTSPASYFWFKAVIERFRGRNSIIRLFVYISFFEIKNDSKTTYEFVVNFTIWINDFPAFINFFFFNKSLKNY